MKTLTLLPRWLFPLAAFRQCLAGLLMVFASAAVTAATTDWQTIEPGGETVCAHGSPYRFFVREADPQKLLVFFQGGGACWSSQNCDLKNRPGFDPFATADDNPATHAAGIFDISNEHNPLQDYSMIFVAYCSGDVHLGNVSRDYPIRDGAGGYDQSLHVEHRGYINARSALDWAEAHFRPTQLVVAGASAGSIAAPFYGQLLARAWPQADVAVISDASGGYRSGAVYGLLHTWGTPQILRQAGDYDQLAAETADFEDLTIQAGLRAKQLRFLHYNTARDESQRFFLSLLGAAADADLVTKIRANEADIRSELPGRFTSFTDTGVEHMILAYPRFYERAVAGTSFRDMVAAFLDGDVRPAVDCGICQQ